MIKGFAVRPVVVLDRSGRAFVIYIVRRVGQHKVGFLALHQNLVGFRLCGIAADESVSAERPNISGLGKHGFFKLGGDIEVIFFALGAIIEQL